MSQQASVVASTAVPRPDVITPEFRAMLASAGVVEAYLFGSVARGAERPDSDIDVLVKFGHPFKLAEQLSLMVELSQLSGRDVEVVTSIDPVFEPYTRPSLVPIPL
jgi:predicted nucleotidyltransferase